MNIRIRLARRLTFILAAGALSIAAQACATSGPATPSGPVELDGTRWKLVAIGGSLDGRVVQFHKRGSNGYIGELVDLGRRLRSVVGLQTGYELFQLKKTPKENEYEGVYKSIDPKGGVADKQVLVFVNGNTLTWNQESATWERQ
jgi:hypothetical protein